MKPVMRDLTPAETAIIVDKGTEPPFSGIFNNHSEAGVYTCRRCSAALYSSDSKFNAGCGWPAFDSEIPGSVEQLPDADGSRTEIVCRGCQAHLGHVFVGEKFTPRNVRHCVNSLSLHFVPVTQLDVNFERAYFAGGCFWGVEYFMQQASGVVKVTSGYMGGKVDDPSYEEVCIGRTGHAEAVEVVFDPRQTSYETLARLFFEIHDPTHLNRQGPDVGTQYRSAIFPLNEKQREIAQKLIGLLKSTGIDPVTTIEPLAKFWRAESYHQNYYTSRNKTPYCHKRVTRFSATDMP